VCGVRVLCGIESLHLPSSRSGATEKARQVSYCVYFNNFFLKKLSYVLYVCRMSVFFNAKAPPAPAP